MEATMSPTERIVRGKKGLTVGEWQALVVKGEMPSRHAGLRQRADGTFRKSDPPSGKQAPLVECSYCGRGTREPSGRGLCGKCQDLGVTTAQLRSVTAQRKSAKARVPVPFGDPDRQRMKSKLERDFADHLNHLFMVGEIVRWTYEDTKLRLGTGSWYTPDFRLIMRDGSIVFYEVKGHQREAALVRIKVASDLYPEYTFIQVKREQGVWIEQRFG